MRKILLISFYLLAATVSGAQDIWQSRLLTAGLDGSLTYHRDDNGFVIPDFSHAGYGGGGVELPRPAAVKKISPLEGDNTAHIQAAIDEVGVMPAGADGMRGALLLGKGLYPVSGTLRLRHDGVVLRGEGNGDDPFSSTIIYAVGCRVSFVDNRGPFAGEVGYVEGTNRDGLFPTSLYDARLKARKLQVK